MPVAPSAQVLVGKKLLGCLCNAPGPGRNAYSSTREIYSEIASYSGCLDHALVYRRISEVHGLPLSDQGVAVVSSPNRAAGAAQYRDHCKERQ
ncbi:MAG: hypothetical protein JWO59_791 [Chloroflexi bacterium]|nr:hypothetical protein [Chloroflexota bacterium]